jgi:hypothetical protein
VRRPLADVGGGHAEGAPSGAGERRIAVAVPRGVEREQVLTAVDLEDEHVVGEAEVDLEWANVRVGDVGDDGLREAGLDDGGGSLRLLVAAPQARTDAQDAPQPR